MRNLGLHSKLARDKGPILFDIFETANKIDEDPAVWIDEPVKLIAVRHGMNTGAAAVFQSGNELLEGHFVADLLALASLVKRDRAVPGVAHKAKFQIAVEQVPADRLPSFERQKQVTTGQDFIAYSTVARPAILQLVLYLPNVLMRSGRLADNSANASGPRFRNFDEYAFVSV